MEFQHNTVVVGARGPVWVEQPINAKFDYNIFYDTWAMGETNTQYLGNWDEKGTDNRVPAIFNFIALDSAKQAILAGKAIKTSADSAAAEALRSVEVKGNIYFWDSKLQGFWTAWDDTAKSGRTDSTVASDSIVTPMFMNSPTYAMFGNTGYPLFAQSGNLVKDPGFGSKIGQVVDGTGSNVGVGLLPWITAIDAGTAGTDYYAFARTNGANMPAWPLAEVSQLYAANLSKAPDGLVYGDTAWSILTAITAPSSVVAAFKLDNNYPNPFNPTTQINYSIAKSGYTTLKVYNVLGQEVATLFAGNQTVGSHVATFDGNRFASGVYFYTLHNAGNFITKKMVLLK